MIQQVKSKVVTLKNTVIATVRNERGRVVQRVIGHNTVTSGNDPGGANYNGRAWILDRVFGFEDYYDSAAIISKMKLGKGTPSNTGLGNAYGSYKTITQVGSMDISSPSAPKVTVKGTWDSGDGSFSGITEAGLFAFVSPSDYTLFAYKTFSPSLSKTAGGTLDIEWTVTLA